MNTLQIDVLNPKANQLLKALADLNLISIRKTKDDAFMKAVTKIRAKAKKDTISLEEITREVETVRTERHERSKR